MQNFFNQKKLKFIFLTFLTGVLVFCFSPQVFAFTSPGVFVTEIKLNEIKGNEIKGEFKVWNSENYYLTDLNYGIKLIQGISPEDQKLIDVVAPKETFFAPPNKTIAKSFNYTYPKNIIGGNYSLRLQIITQSGDELGWKNIVIPLEGQNKFLEISDSSSKLLTGNRENFPLAGALASLKTDIAVSLEVKNPAEQITVVPHIRIFNRMYNMSLAKEYDDSPITFAKNETKEIKLALPKFDVPESYLAEVKFYEDNQQVSGTAYFRWVIEGEGGKILYLKAGKDYYKAGENIEIKVDSIGPADFSSLKTGKLQIIIYDQNGSRAYDISKDVVLNSSVVSSAITIPSRGDLVSFSVEAKLLSKEGKVLDSKKIAMPVYSSEAKELSKKELVVKIISACILLVLLILVFGFIFFGRRVKESMFLRKLIKVFKK